MQLIKGLQFRTQISNKFGHSISDKYEPSFATGTGALFGGFAQVNTWLGNDLLNENYFTYNKTLNSIHAITVVAGYTTQTNTVRQSREEGHTFTTDNLKTGDLNSAAVKLINPEGSPTPYTKWVLNSWVGRANYSLKDKYLVTFTARADGSSKLVPTINGLSSHQVPWPGRYMKSNSRKLYQQFLKRS